MVDADWKPSMGFVYGELKVAKEEIMKALGGNEKAYKPIIDIINNKMKDFEMERQVVMIDLPKYKEKLVDLELAIKGCMVNNADFDPDEDDGDGDEVDPEPVMEKIDEALKTNNNQVPRKSSTTTKLYNEDFESENDEQVFEEDEYESNGVKIVEELED
ncbi:unnamed protein product [Lactuca saligna]|uniref:Uncharacterized protein n=1 Tax=Lactuca saligna TaxID=75948 RepID=A0AA36EAA0_LACSI|nr:unnamed protein product [Lactuca saligna]